MRDVADAASLADGARDVSQLPPAKLGALACVLHDLRIEAHAAGDGEQLALAMHA